MQGWQISRGGRAALALAVAIATLAVLAPPSPAIVPPSDCGRLTVKAKRYTIKADQLRCASARAHARRYLQTKRRPSGYTCRNFGAETKLKFRCSRGVKVFFAIRR
jgi:hypothetical protein